MKVYLKRTFIVFSFVYLLWLDQAIFGQSANEVFQRISTLVKSETPAGTNTGTGFFYQQMGSKKPGDQPQWVKIENLWLITNRHVLIPEFNGKEIFPTSFTFYMRRVEKGELKWEPITLDKEEIMKRAKFPADPSIDVCAISVMDIVTKKVMEMEKLEQNGIGMMPWHGVTKDDFAGADKITAEAGDDVLVIGYPHGFYDQVNLFPIIKAGVIASKWGANFRGQRFFLVDAKLFPNSSGSIVVSKPTSIVIKDGQIYSSGNKRFAFLGVYSGEYSLEGKKDSSMTDKISVNLGIIWYADVIEEIVEKGETFKQSASTNK